MGICAINSSWSAKQGGWCMCNTQYGLDGPDCRDICPNGQALLILNITNMILGFAGSLFCFYFLIKLRLRDRGKYHQGTQASTPISLILILAGMGMLLFTIYLLLATFNTIGFRDFAVNVTVGGRQLRRSSQTLTNAAFFIYGLASCTGICSIFILPLTWVSFCLEVK
jgi:hypothetical protein